MFQVTASALIMLAAAGSFGQACAQDLRAELSREMPALMELYRDLHASPELSFEEHETAAKLAARMRKLGFQVTEGVGKTGVVAILRNGPGPVLMLRTDMDGLPVTERTGLPFASRATAISQAGVESGVMHACGHDTHMTAWIAAAKLLVARKGEWSGTLMMIAQPAEELGLGAAAMLDDGLFTRFARPDYVLAAHDSADDVAGAVRYVPEFAMANVDSVDVLVRGVGGHGAVPHATKDPVVIASAIVTRLQTLVSRELDPIDSAVVTVGSFHAGTKHNIIPDEARLQLTVRSYSDETRKRLLDGIARIARGEAIAAGLSDDLMPVVTVPETYTPAVYNSPDFTAAMGALLAERFGAGRVAPGRPTMAGEDFSHYRRTDPGNIQSMLFWVGGVKPEDMAAKQEGAKELPSLHSPFWAPDAEAVIATAAESLAAMSLHLLARPEG